MKKLLLVALLVLFATQNARAEKDGFFLGGGFPIVSVGLTKDEGSRYRRWWYSNQYEYYNDKDLNIAFLNLAFGYSQALGERLGLRYYGSVYLNASSINADFLNVDVLFSVVKGEKAELRVFAGGWLGWVIYPYGNGSYYDESIEGLDFGLNAGLRFVAWQRYGFEFYGRFGFLTQSGEYTESDGWYQQKSSQPYQIGFRYTISF